MNSASRRIPPSEEPLAPRSLGTLAAALVTCTHPEGSHVRAAPDLGPGETGIYWCAACGALHPGAGPEGAWQAPALTSGLTKKHFEDLALLLHSIVQLTQLARAHGSPGGSASSTPIFLRVRASLSELSRLPVVRDVGRLEEAIAAMPPSPVRPPSR